MAFNLDDLKRHSVVDEAGCWIWQRAKAGVGYGMIWNPEAGKVVYAHRLAAEIAHGPCPVGKEVMHSCDVRDCINPAHLSYGTRAENIADMWAKGRGRPGSSRGEDHGMAKLTEAQVLEIRRRRENGVILRVLAEDYGVTISNIHLIATGKKWVHI